MFICNPLSKITPPGVSAFKVIGLLAVPAPEKVMRSSEE